MSFIPKSIQTAVEARNYVEQNNRFAEMALDNIHENTLTRRKLSLVFLSIASPKSNNDTLRYTKRQFDSKKKLCATVYHRFVLLGDSETSRVVIMFTQTREETNTLFRFQQTITPGTPVWVLCPKSTGLLGATNEILQSKHPLIPRDKDAVPFNIHPCFNDINDDYCYFRFTTKSLQVGECILKHNVCNGSLCDGSNESSCGCFVSGQGRFHALSFMAICEEFNLERCNFESIDVQSRSFLLRVVANDFMYNGNVEPVEFDQGISYLVNHQNEFGFEVTGWFRPAKDEGDVVRDAQVLHIVNINFVGEESAEAAALRYKNPTNDTNLSENDCL